MKIITYLENDKEQLGVLVDTQVYNISNGNDEIAKNMLQFLGLGDEGMKKASEVESAIRVITSSGSDCCPLPNSFIAETVY